MIAVSLALATQSKISCLAVKTVQHKTPFNQAVLLRMVKRGFSFVYGGKDMKFFRMDSDQPDWQIWATVYEEIGRHDFLLAKAMFFDLYSLMAQETGQDTSKNPQISIRKLAESLRISRRKCADTLLKLCQLFAISSLIVRRNSDGSPQIVEIHYPNFLKKQKKFFKSGSDGGGDKTRQEERIQDIEGEKTVCPSLINETWLRYSEAHKNAYGVELKRNSQIDKQISELIERVGNHAPDIAEYFLTRDTKFYIGKGHALKFAVTDADTLLTALLQRQKRNGGGNAIQSDQTL